MLHFGNYLSPPDPVVIATSFTGVLSAPALALRLISSKALLGFNDKYKLLLSTIILLLLEVNIADDAVEDLMLVLLPLLSLFRDDLRLLLQSESTST